MGESRTTKLWFDQDIFNGVEMSDIEDDTDEEGQSASVLSESEGGLSEAGVSSDVSVLYAL